MALFHAQRRRVRAELVLRLKALEPPIAQQLYLLRHLMTEYNGVLEQARVLQGAILDDLEHAQERGEGPGNVDYCHWFWSRLDLVDLILPASCALEDAARLEGLPGDV